MRREEQTHLSAALAAVQHHLCAHAGRLAVPGGRDGPANQAHPRLGDGGSHACGTGDRCPEDGPDDHLLHHIDRGTQYACQDYRQLLADHDITCSSAEHGFEAGEEW